MLRRVAGVSRRPTKGRLGLHAINISKPEPRFIPSCTSTTNRLLPNAPRFIRFATPLRSAYVLGVVLSIDGSTCTSDHKTVTAQYQCIAVPEGLSDNDVIILQLDHRDVTVCAKSRCHGPTYLWMPPAACAAVQTRSQTAQEPHHPFRSS